MILYYIYYNMVSMCGNALYVSIAYAIGGSKTVELCCHICKSMPLLLALGALLTMWQVCVRNALYVSIAYAY